ncbi:helix-turn-helix domain-containing protein [Providencia stuartii]|uniref:Uncharacterized protein n=1 Tax=Providencia stuartii TaxID=588 RepID=A0A1S1HTR4_PROST|nr:helix-turn-helix domain-containing protein [Providencia stuartii]OHT25744.1 hypothetical protein A3Q29_12135 [Providencia stuartii]
MEIKLHANATTTPRVRRYLQQSDKSDRELAKELGISVSTVRRWRVRQDVEDQKSTPKNTHKVMRQEQVNLALWLRTHFILPLDELIICINEGMGQTISRASLGRLLKKGEMVHMNVLGSRVLKGKKAIQRGEQCGKLRLYYRRLNLLPQDGGQLHVLWLEEQVSGFSCVDVFQGISAQLVVNWLKEVQTRLPDDIQCLETENRSLFLESVFDEHPLQQWCAEQEITLSYFDVEHEASLRLDIPLSALLPAINGLSLTEFLPIVVQMYNQHWEQKKLGSLTPYEFWRQNSAK